MGMEFWFAPWPHPLEIERWRNSARPNLSCATTPSCNKSIPKSMPCSAPAWNGRWSAPNHATAWACLSNLYQLEYFDRFNPQEKPLERAREAAWRAVKIDPACQLGWKELAAVHFFSRDF